MVLQYCPRTPPPARNKEGAPGAPPPPLVSPLGIPPSPAPPPAKESPRGETPLRPRLVSDARGDARARRGPGRGWRPRHGPRRASGYGATPRPRSAAPVPPVARAIRISCPAPAPWPSGHGRNALAPRHPRAHRPPPLACKVQLRLRRAAPRRRAPPGISRAARLRSLRRPCARARSGIAWRGVHRKKPAWMRQAINASAARAQRPRGAVRCSLRSPLAGFFRPPRQPARASAWRPPRQAAPPEKAAQQQSPFFARWRAARATSRLRSLTGPRRTWPPRKNGWRVSRKNPPPLAGRTRPEFRSDARLRRGKGQTLCQPMEPAFERRSTSK